MCGNLQEVSGLLSCVRTGNIPPPSGNLAKSVCSEVEDHADENIVLPALAGVHIALRLTRPEIFTVD
jgi:hypothetical protein